MKNRCFAVALAAVISVSALGNAVAEDAHMHNPMNNASSNSPIMTMEHNMPQPTANHKWLKHFIGEWDTKTKMFMAPGQPPQLSEASQVVRPLGEFWVLSEYDGSFMNKPFQGIQTIGYDVNKGKYVATWTDNMTGYLWNYEGILDQAKNTLTMEAEGYCPMKPGKLTRFRDIIEMKTPDHMTYTSLMLDDNGQWVTMMTAESYRVDEESDAEQ